MFARFTRFPLHRCIHTSSSAGRTPGHLNRTAKVVLGASIATAAYMTWRLTQESNKLALDSPTASADSRIPQSALVKSQTPPAPSEPQKASEASPFTPDEPQTGPSDGGFMPDSKEPGVPSPEASSSQNEGTEPSGSGKTASGGAFNPETGEINWDCPCLGGMAHGPCGEQFREAFSCFVFSEAEPKGINCVEKFQAMQTCFKDHPEVYADQLMDDDDEEAESPAAASADKSEDMPPVSEVKEKLSAEASPTEVAPEKKPRLQKPQPATGS